MRVRDIMTTNVITIAPDTSIINTKRIMREHNFRRLPVVKDGELVGIVTDKDLEKASPRGGSAGGLWEFSYNVMSVFGTRVEEIMKRDVVTATPAMTVEEALSLAQSRKVGALVVVEGKKVVGIATTNDFFYGIVNKVLGVGEHGARIQVVGGGESKRLEEVISLINKHRLDITNIHIFLPVGKTKRDVVVHVNSEDVEQLVAELKAKGYRVGLRKR